MPAPLAPPRPDRTVHFIGDLHAGAIRTDRSEQVVADLARDEVPDPVAHVQVGDQTENAGSTKFTSDGAEDALALAWLDSLPAPWYAACGNHDFWFWNTRTVAQWAAAYGLAKNYEVDLGFVRLLFVGPDDANTPYTLTLATLDWLDEELRTSGKDCWIVCHYPLLNTCLGPTSGDGAQYSSAETAFHIEPDATIRAILNDRPRAKAWISGHTHSDIEVPGFLKAENVGDRSIAAINCSALAYTGRGIEYGHDPIRSLYVTRRASGRIEVRIRNHGAHCWDAISGQRVAVF